MISFKFTPKKSDYQKATLAFLVINKSFRNILVFLLFPLLICILSAVIRGEFGRGMSALLPLIPIILVPLLLGFVIFIAPFLRNDKNNQYLYSPIEGLANDEHILFKNQFGETKLNWSSFSQAIETKNAFLLVYSSNKNMSQMIPKRAFESKEDEKNFASLLIAKIQEYQISISGRQNNPKATAVWILFIAAVLFLLITAIIDAIK